MRDKVERRLYRSFQEFADDFELVCRNARIYNAPETRYYKSADRLYAAGIKVVQKELERIKYYEQMRKTDMTSSSEMVEMPNQQGTFVKSSTSSPKSTRNSISEMDEDVDILSSGRSVTGDYVPSNLTKVQIDDSREAKSSDTSSIIPALPVDMKRLSKKIALYKKNPQGGYLFTSAQRSAFAPDGSLLTASGIKELSLVPAAPLSSSKIPKLNHVVMDSSSKWAPPSIDLLQNLHVPVNFLDYGPFDSFGPSHDSSRSTLSAKETILGLLAYGDSQGLNYVRSLDSFMGDMNDRVQTQTRRYLDEATRGMHSYAHPVAGLDTIKTSSSPIATSMAAPIPTVTTTTTKTLDDSPTIDHESLVESLLHDDPILVRMVFDRKITKDAEEHTGDMLMTASDRMGSTAVANSSSISTSRISDELELLLYRNAELLLKLQRLQQDRYTAGKMIPSETEQTVARELRQNLTRLVGNTAPSKLISRQTIETWIKDLQTPMASYRGTLPPSNLRVPASISTHPTSAGSPMALPLAQTTKPMISSILPMMRGYSGRGRPPSYLSQQARATQALIAQSQNQTISPQLVQHIQRQLASRSFIDPTTLTSTLPSTSHPTLMSSYRPTL